MFSLQRLLGEDKRFLRLLEASAMEAAQSVAALRALLADEKNKPTLKTFATLRHKEKDIMNQIADLLVRALVVAMEREDIEALADSLYRIPKTVEKFAERYIISSAQVGDVDFSRQ
jgi:response regulator RpfG family c-di-GMP phosphodiesterase